MIKKLPLDPRNHQPDLPLPDGLSREKIFRSLTTLSVNDSHRGELEAYARLDCDRFLYTLDLIPEQAVDILEIGGNPYFTSVLIERHRPNARLAFTNYFGQSGGIGVDKVTLDDYSGKEETFQFSFHHANVEEDDLPIPDNSFDCVLFCEVIEHLLRDPMHALLEIHRVLRPGGYLVLTTPNVARLENVARMIGGVNIYDPYSGSGPYGRRNREYSRHELYFLLLQCGFQCRRFFTADVHDNLAAGYNIDGDSLARLVEGRKEDLGQYHFTCFQKEGDVETRRPSWLYRSLPEGEIIEKNI